MNKLKNLEYSNKQTKVILDEHGKIIKTAESILCEQVDSEGNTTLKFVQTQSDCNASSSAVVNEDQMPCNTVITTQESTKNWYKDLRKLFAAYEFARSSSDSSDEEIQYMCLLKGNIPRIENYITNVVGQFTEEQFQRQFRLSLGTCNHLIDLFERSKYYPKNICGRKKTTATEHILVFLWLAANKTVIRSVAERFNMQIATIHVIIKRVMDFLLSLAPSIIRFPATEEEREENAREFRNICGIDGIVGCIDGTYIPIRTPANKIRHTYVNRHDASALTLQGICDAKLRFIDCFTGVSSKMHDARVYDLSFIKEKISTMSDNYHTIGDAAYPISVNLVTPYNGNLTPMQANFNNHFCRARVKIENAFGLLKCRFQQLLRLDMWSVLFKSNFIISCCVLHNLCIDRNDILDYYDYEEVLFPIEQYIDNVNVNRTRLLGQMKRDRLALDLM